VLRCLHIERFLEGFCVRRGVAPRVTESFREKLKGPDIRQPPFLLTTLHVLPDICLNILSFLQRCTANGQNDVANLTRHNTPNQRRDEIVSIGIFWQIPQNEVLWARPFSRLQRDEAPHKTLNCGSIDTALALTILFTNQREKNDVRESPSRLWRCRLNDVKRILRTISCHLCVLDHDDFFVTFLEGRLQEFLWDSLHLRAVQELRASSTVEIPKWLRRVGVPGQQSSCVIVIVISQANILTPATHNPLP